MPHGAFTSVEQGTKLCREPVAGENRYLTLCRITVLSRGRERDLIVSSFQPGYVPLSILSESSLNGSFLKYFLEYHSSKVL